MGIGLCSSDACWPPAEGGVQGGRGLAALGPHVWRVRRWGWKQNSGPRSLGPLGSRDAKCFQFDVRKTLEGAVGKPGASGELWRALLSASICLEACASQPPDFRLLQEKPISCRSGYGYDFGEALSVLTLPGASGARLLSAPKLDKQMVREWAISISILCFS